MDNTTPERDTGPLAPEERGEHIRLIAYSIWEEEGCPDGRADEHWIKAEAIFEAQCAVENMRNPEWLKRDTGAQEAMPARQTTGEPAGVVLPRQNRRTAA